MSASAFAPAKVNLFLHVGPLGSDGFHPLASLMVFADVGDRVRLADGPAGLQVQGLFAPALAGLDPRENLVMRAAAALGAGEAHLVLEKDLPVASGLGGGSADAGAALRLLRETRRLPLDDAGMERVAAALGSDGPACLWGAPVVAEGRGERLSPAPALPELHAVLVNPGVACPTGAVYRAFDADPFEASADRPDMPAVFADVGELVDFLRETRNDLEAPAAGLVPAVAATLGRLRAQPEALFVRLSGSGATCFVLCADAGAAVRLAARLSPAHPGWWVRPCRLGGPWG